MASYNTPFPLGAFLNAPDGSNAANQAGFQTNYNSFTALMGEPPAFLDYFVSYDTPVSTWVSGAGWQAWSAAQSPSSATETPVIALPMYSLAAGELTPDQQYQAIVSGQDDSVFTGIVNAWAAQGFKNLVFRPGWEMNLQGPTYAGATAQDQADWVSAFQHIYTVLHQAGAAAGVSVSVVWNPATINYETVNATTTLYPGNNYVDAIGADAYSDIFPYADTTNPNVYHDWATGGVDTSVAQFMANPINRAHYWSYPSATKWALDSSGGHDLSLNNLIQFAEQQGKAFAIPEAGAGASNSGADVSDDGAYPAWLAAQLTAAQAAGEKIDFVNLWDSNGGSNYQFSNASDGKPQEAAAWAQYFGAQTPVTTGAPTSDVLTLRMAEDYWVADAQFTVSVDGTQVGGVDTVSTLHASGDDTVFALAGSWGSGAHSVQISFINDAWGGTPQTDRNLIVGSIAYDGVTYGGTTATLWGNSTQTFNVGGSAPVATAPADTLVVHVAQDYWNGNAKFAVSIDGQAVSTPQDVVTLHSSGGWEDFTFTGNFGAGSHTVGVSFTNDAYGGTPSTDRNLYVNGITLNGQNYGSGVTTLLSNGTTSFAITTKG